MAFKYTERATPLSGVQTSGAAGTAVNHGVISSINSVPLEAFEKYLITLDISVGSTGGAWDLFIQVPRVTDPVATTDAHWQDLVHFAQIAAGNVVDQVWSGPMSSTVNGGNGSIDAVRNAESLALSGDSCVWIPVGEQIRVVSVTAAGVTVAATFSLHIAGFNRRF